MWYGSTLGLLSFSKLQKRSFNGFGGLHLDSV